jgi:cytoplasmic iron level regulating protein YaaA (DUF328/UPF0246 family)
VLPPAPSTRPDFLDHSAQLIDILKQKSPAEIASLMSISDPLAALNAARFGDWTPTMPLRGGARRCSPSMAMSMTGWMPGRSTKDGLAWLQAHVRILSGLYGVLRPLDLMLPYRLEMGTRLPNARGKDLYAFWGDLPAQALNALLANDSKPVLVNLASDEYFKAVKRKRR